MASHQGQILSGKNSKVREKGQKQSEKKSFLRDMDSPAWLVPARDRGSRCLSIILDY